MSRRDERERGERKAPKTAEAGMVKHAQNSIAAASALHSKVNADVLAVPGMSSPKVRHLLNNLCDFDGCNYLEIGSWKGSTVIAAAFRNRGRFTAIESFAKWRTRGGDAKVALLANQKRFRRTAPFDFHESDCWAFDVGLLPPGVNVYFYDGDHRPEATARAFTHFDAALADTFILVMDDWNRPHIRTATRGAIAGAYKTLYQRELFTPGHKNDSHENPTSWWNGIYVAVLRKGRR
jgi:hypothetical protein